MAPYFSDLLNIKNSTAAAYYDYTKYIKILAIGVFFSLMDTHFKSVMRMLRKPKDFLKVTAVSVFFIFTLTIFIVVLNDGGIKGVFIAAVLSSAISSLFGYWLVRNNYTGNFSLAFLMLFFSYALPQFPSVFFNWGISQSNRFFLNYYSTLEQQGLYAIGFKVASVFLLFATAFRLAWDPYALSIKDESYAKEAYKNFYMIFILVFTWIAFSVSIFAKPLLLLLTPTEYHSSYILASILAFAFLFQSVNNILGLGINLTKKTKYTSYIQAFVFIVMVLMSLVVIPYFEAYGAVVVFLISMFIQGLLYYIVSERLYYVGYEFWKLNSYVFIIFFISMIVQLLYSQINSLTSLMSYSFFISILFLIVSYFFISKLKFLKYKG
jgi:O-antigen/teichoic acid export membrane protein